MLKITKTLVCLLTLLVFNNSYSQLGESQKPSWSETLDYKFVPSISDQIKDGTFIPADTDAHKKLGREKREQIIHLETQILKLEKVIFKDNGNGVTNAKK